MRSGLYQARLRRHVRTPSGWCSGHSLAECARAADAHGDCLRCSSPANHSPSTIRASAFPSEATTPSRCAPEGQSRPDLGSPSAHDRDPATPTVLLHRSCPLSSTTSHSCPPSSTGRRVYVPTDDCGSRASRSSAPALSPTPAPEEGGPSTTAGAESRRSRRARRHRRIRRLRARAEPTGGRGCFESALGLDRDRWWKSSC